MASSSTANLFSFFTPPKPPTLKFLPPQLALAPPLTAKVRISWSQPQVISFFDGNRQLPFSSSSSDELMSVVYPSLANANVLFFRSAYNVQVIVDDNEPEEKLLNRFRREVMRAGVIQECKRRRFFENKHDEKKRKTREAAKRNRRRRPLSRFSPQDRQETSKSKKEDEDDNWELPDGDLPY